MIRSFLEPQSVVIKHVRGARLVIWCVGGSLPVAARCIIEGPKREVILLGGRSIMEQSRLFSSRNRLLRHDIQLGESN